MRDQRLLLLSVWVSAAFAVVSSVWGILAGSSMIVFDGLYSFVSVGLSLMAVLALRFARRGPDDRFPWGREAAEPVAVVLKAGILAALCVYAAVQGVVELVHGGREMAFDWAVAYAVLTAGVVLGVGLYLRRRAESDLVRAEADEWLADSALSAFVLVGFVIALVLDRTGHGDLAASVDPLMVVLGSVVFLRTPVRLITAGMREVLAMAPPPAVLDDVHASVEAVRERHGLGESVVRATKVGGRVDLDVVFVVGEDGRALTVPECDAVRADLVERLASRGYDRALTVSFTADRRYAVWP